MIGKEEIDKAEVFAKKYYDQYYEDPRLWKNHIQLVRKYAIELSEKEKTDKLCLELAAILHDIGKYRGRKNHHFVGYQLAKTFLRTLNNKRSETKIILKCIKKHRTKYASNNQRLEVKVIQAADVIGTLFDDEWQEYSPQTLKKAELEQLYERAYGKIHLKSAQMIASKQISLLRNKIPT